MTMVTPPMRVACTSGPSPLSAKNSMNQKITAAVMHSTSHSVTGITPDGAVHAVVAGQLAVGGLVEPLAVGRLGGRGLRGRRCGGC